MLGTARGSPSQARGSPKKLIARVEWDLGAAAGGGAFGLTRDEWQASRPALLPDGELALDAWHFCEGWQPDRIALAAAYLEVADVDLLTDMLLAIRNTIARHQQAQGQAGGK